MPHCFLCAESDALSDACINCTSGEPNVEDAIEEIHSGKLLRQMAHSFNKWGRKEGRRENSRLRALAKSWGREKGEDVGQRTQTFSYKINKFWDLNDSVMMQ